MNATSEACYRIVTIPKQPFVEYDEEEETYSGMLIDLVKEIARRLNFQYNISARSEGDYGYMDDEGNWNGLIGDLRERKADIGLGALDVMSERMRVVDFTEPIFEPTGISVLMLKPESQSTLFRSFIIFPPFAFHYRRMSERLHPRTDPDFPSTGCCKRVDVVFAALYIEQGTPRISERLREFLISFVIFGEAPQGTWRIPERLHEILREPARF